MGAHNSSDVEVPCSDDEIDQNLIGNKPTNSVVVPVSPSYSQKEKAPLAHDFNWIRNDLKACQVQNRIMLTKKRCYLKY